MLSMMISRSRTRNKNKIKILWLISNTEQGKYSVINKLNITPSQVSVTAAHLK